MHPAAGQPRLEKKTKAHTSQTTNLGAGIPPAKPALQRSGYLIYDTQGIGNTGRLFLLLGA